MSYSIANITTIADCDELITKIQREKDLLDFRKLSLEFRLDAYSERANQMESNHMNYNNEMTSIDNTLATLQTGTTVYEEFQSRKTKLAYKIFLNDQRRENYNNISLIMREADVELVAKQVVEIDSLLATIQAHKATL